MNEREVAKIEKYKVLKDEIITMWDIKEVIVIPVVVGALGQCQLALRSILLQLGLR